MSLFTYLFNLIRKTPVERQDIQHNIAPQPREQSVQDAAIMALDALHDYNPSGDLEGSDGRITPSSKPSGSEEEITDIAAAAGITPPSQGDRKKTALHEAICMEAYCGNELNMRRNIQKIPDLITPENINAQDEKGNTALHLLLQHRYWFDYHEKIFNMLIDNGARVDLVNDKGRTALHEMMLNEDCSGTAFNKIITAGADINALDEADKTPLHLFFEVSHNHYMIPVSLLINNGADIHAQDNKGNTPFHIAITSKSFLYKLKTLTYLLDNGAGINTPNNDGDTPLHFLARYNIYDMSDHRETVELLLTRGANKNLKNKKGQLPLHIAIKRHGSTVIDLLKPDCVDQSADSQGRTALHIIASDESFNIELFRTTLLESTEPMAPDNNGETPLHYAASIGFHEAIEEIPTTPTTINLVNNDGNTAIYFAVMSLLSDQFNSPNGVTDQDIPNIKEIVEVLSNPKTHRFNIDARLSTLSYMRQRIAINALLNKGADPRIKNQEGYNAISTIQRWVNLFGSNPNVRRMYLI